VHKKLLKLSLLGGAFRFCFGLRRDGSVDSMGGNCTWRKLGTSYAQVEGETMEIHIARSSWRERALTQQMPDRGAGVVQHRYAYFQSAFDQGRVVTSVGRGGNLLPQPSEP